MPVEEAVDHFRVAGVQLQGHPVFDKAGDVVVQEDAGLDHFVRGLVICMRDKSLRPTAKRWEGALLGPLPSVRAARFQCQVLALGSSNCANDVIGEGCFIYSIFIIITFNPHLRTCLLMRERKHVRTEH